MATQKFSIGEAIRFGRKRARFGLFIGPYMLVALPLFIPIIFGILLPIVLWEKIFFQRVFLSFFPPSFQPYVFALIGIIIPMVWIKISLRSCDNEKGRLSGLFPRYRSFFNFLFAWVLYCPIVFSPMILLITAGISEVFRVILGLILAVFLGIKFCFFPYFIFDKETGPIEAFKRSFDITRGVEWDLFAFFLVVAIINLVGAVGVLFVIAPISTTMMPVAVVVTINLLRVLALGWGLFVIATTMTAVAFVYRKLLSQTEIAPVLETP